MRSPLFVFLPWQSYGLHRNTKRGFHLSSIHVRPPAATRKENKPGSPTVKPNEGMERIMSVREMKNYGEWPYWHELADMMVTVAIFKIVSYGICHYGWNESPSAVVDMSRNDLVDFAVKQHMALINMGSSPAAMMSICGGLGVDIDISNDSALVMQAIGLSDYLTGKENDEPLECTSSGKAWSRMCGYLQNSESFKALLSFIAEWHGGEEMKTRIRKYGLCVATTSYAYSITESSFKEAYPNS